MKKALPRVIAKPAEFAGFAMTNQELFSGQSTKITKLDLKYNFVFLLSFVVKFTDLIIPVS